MATVDRQSLREEFERLKAQFEHLSATDNKMSAETRTLINALLMLLKVLMAIFMEKTTGKGRRHSSLPPSQTSKDETAATRPGGKSKGQEQNAARSRHSRTVTTTEVVAVDACANCGADLGHTPSPSRQRRTRIDILFEKVVHHVDAQVKDCPRCRQRTTGRFPADLSGPRQYGNGLKAYMMNLLIAQMVPLDRMREARQPLAQQRVDLRRVQFLGQTLRQRRIGAGQDAVVQRLERDAALGELPLDVLVAVDAQPGGVGEVRAELHEQRPEVVVDQIEVVERLTARLWRY